MKAIMLKRDFKQAGQLKPDKIDTPLRVEDNGGEASLRFNYPLQEHEAAVHTLRIYAGMTMQEVIDSVSV